LHEILEHLPSGARVLDLGCREGSFSEIAYDFLTIRVDLNRPRVKSPFSVQADAVHLPFRSCSFDAVILNHSVEHFVHLKPALQEIGRVIKREGAAFVAVPDGRTLTDRIYRKLFLNVGGHVNLFDSATELEKMLAWYFGLPHVATRTLFSSLSFLNRKNTQDPSVRRQMRFGGLWEPFVAMATATTRMLDRWFATRQAYMDGDSILATSASQSAFSRWRMSASGAARLTPAAHSRKQAVSGNGYSRIITVPIVAPSIFFSGMVSLRTRTTPIIDLKRVS
jgi:SAM-dependent methyltransferase